MKNKLVLLGMMVLMGTAGVLAGCNKQIMDLTYSYEEAILQLPNGTIVEGKVQSWTDYADGDQIQVKVNGKQ